MLHQTELLQALYDAATLRDDDLVADVCFRLDQHGVGFRAQNAIFAAAHNSSPFPGAEIAHLVGERLFYRHS